MLIGWAKSNILSSHSTIICLLIVCVVAVRAEETDEYTSDIAIKLKREYADDLVSDLFASSYDLTKVARVFDLDENGLFHFRINNAPIDEEDMKPSNVQPRHRRTKRFIENKIDMLRRDDRVDYVMPQLYLKREKRRYWPRDTDSNEAEFNQLYEEILRKQASESYEMYKRKKLLENLLDDSEEENEEDNDEEKKIQLHIPDEIDFNDRLFGKQWYLINEGQLKIPPLHDLNVKHAWLNGYTGKNVSIVIIDDGLDHEHPDFKGKYRADLSYDFNDESDKNHDPMPSTFDDRNSHGTKCAGTAAASANNTVCGVGVAYDAQVAGIRILDGAITDVLEARALAYKSKQADIKSASWGPSDDGSHMEYPGKFVNLALEDGVKNGRNGKGTLYVWAAGNGGINDDDCSCDGYVSNWNVISIGSVTHRGVSPTFMELCPSTMAVAYSGGHAEIGNDDDPGIRVIASDVRGKCTTTFQGTSAAAPLAAGAFALVLEANPDLTYRDVMHLIARTSRVPNIEDHQGWIINGANYHVNEKYGFGVLDVSQLIQEAQGWENVPERDQCTAVYDQQLPISFNQNYTKVLELKVTNCSNIDFLEHVVTNVSFVYGVRGQIKMTLISPSGTPSEILSFRKNDKNSKGVSYFPFMTVFNWGEAASGTWKLMIETADNQESLNGNLTHFSINFYGFKVPKESKLTKRFDELKRAFVPSQEHLKRIYDSELKLSSESKIVHKRDASLKKREHIEGSNTL